MLRRAGTHPRRLCNAFAISGTLRATDGSVLARKRFSVSLDPSTTMLLASEKSPNAVAEILDLGATETDGTGKFVVQIPALRGIDSYVEPDGSVGLLFQGLDDGFELMWRTPVHLPTGKATRATAETPDDKVYRKSLQAAKAPNPAQARASASATDAGSASSVTVNQLDLTALVTAGSAKAAKSVTAGQPKPRLALTFRTTSMLWGRAGLEPGSRGARSADGKHGRICW